MPSHQHEKLLDNEEGANFALGNEETISFDIQHHRVQHPIHIRSWVNERGWGLLFGCINIVALLILFFLAFHRRSDLDYRTPMIRSFQRNESFMSIAHEFDGIWFDQVFYPVGAFSSSGLDHEEFGVFTMFHQLHCLDSFRKALQRASAGEWIGVDDDDDKHWPHCLDYIRQSILCYADDTVERFNILPNGTRKFTISGYQDMRACKSSQPLFDAQKRYHEYKEQHLHENGY